MTPAKILLLVLVNDGILAVLFIAFHSYLSGKIDAAESIIHGKVDALFARTKVEITSVQADVAKLAADVKPKV